MEFTSVSDNDVTVSFSGALTVGMFSLSDMLMQTYDAVAENYVVVECYTDPVLGIDYRFGFNGKEKDNEVKGLGNS